jgi:hypothetical protein
VISVDGDEIGRGYVQDTGDAGVVVVKMLILVYGVLEISATTIGGDFIKYISDYLRHLS